MQKPTFPNAALTRPGSKGIISALQNQNVFLFKSSLVFAYFFHKNVKSSQFC